MSSQIARLAEADAAARLRGEEITALHSSALDADLRAMVSQRLMRIDGNGLVQVYVQPSGTIKDAVTDLQSAGGRVERSSDAAAIVQAWIPVSQLETLAVRSSIGFIRLPEYGVVQAGSVNTQGDSILKAPQARSGFSVNGTGVKVGVISDGVGGIGSSQSTGDLGSVDTTTCNVVPGSNPQASGAEGTAMLEIVHDLAPGAELWFGNFAGGTALDFNAAVDCLAANTDVVVDDVGFFNAGPYDGTSFISTNTSTELNRNTNRIRGYYTSVANQAISHYQESYVSCSGGTRHGFSATASTLDLGGFGPRCYSPISVPGGALLRVFLQWNDPFSASCNDYDMSLFTHNTATPLSSSTNPQTCSQHPTEAIVWQNPLASAQLVDLVIDKFSGAAVTFDLFVLGGAVPNFLTPGSSVPNQSDAGGGVVSVGAIQASDPGNDTIAIYSSQGPTNDGRTKPDITGIDCVAITGAAGFPNPFCGTSAAAPHIAGIAALLLQCKSVLKAGEPGDDPSADRIALRNALVNSASDLGTAGPDNVFGSGRANALAAANGLCPPATPTPTPAPTAVPGAFGNVDCTGGINSVDALKVLRYSAALAYTQNEPCEDIGVQTLPNLQLQADIDCSTTVNSVDALKLLRYSAGLPVTQIEPEPDACPDIGTGP